MRIIHSLIALALVPLSAFAVDDSRKDLSFYLDAVIPHFAVGGPEWQTTFIFHNPSDQPEKFYLNFTGDDGKPQAIPALGGMATSVIVTLPPHTTQKLVSDYRPDLPVVSGGVLITASCGDCRFAASTVHTIFSRYDWVKKVFNSEATVPQESQFDNVVTLVFDQENFVMGVALMNPSTAEAKIVTATVYSKDNVLLYTEQFDMTPLAHLVFSLDSRYPVTAGRLGYVKFSTLGTTGIAGIALRFAPNNTFTSMHLIGNSVPVGQTVSDCVPSVESRISGEFTGWTGQTTFLLDSGQIWRQAAFAYTYSYKFHPEVVIYKTAAGCRMTVLGVDSTILVQRIN